MVDIGTVKKNWRELTITSDFIFENVIQMSDNCLNLLRAIIPELELKELKRAEIQKHVKDKKDMHGVRFDAFAEDKDGHFFELEMQTEKEEALGQRIRYYQSKIDISSLREGKDYKHLSKSFVIFLMNYDHFGRGRYRYVFHN